MFDWAFFLAPLAVGKRLLRLDPPAAPEKPQPAPPRAMEVRREPALMTPAELRIRRVDAMLEHVDLYVLAAKFADWMREIGEHGVYLPCQIDDALALFCDAKNYYCPSGDQLRAALGPTHGVSKRRVWRSDPLMEGLYHLTDAQRPYLYIISRTPPKSRVVYRSISDQQGLGETSGRDGSDMGLEPVQTRLGPGSDERQKKRRNTGRSAGDGHRRAA